MGGNSSKSKKKHQQTTHHLYHPQSPPPPAYEAYRPTARPAARITRYNGEYKCSLCGHSWSSANAWHDKWQQCKRCGHKVFPHRLLQAAAATVPGYNAAGDPKNHRRDLCQKCIELGRSCRKA